MNLRSKLFYSYLAFVILYAALILLPAPPSVTLARYHLSSSGLRLIDVTIIVLMAAIWFAGFVGYARLRSYTRLIEDNKDGRQVAKLTLGIFFLVLWLPVSSVVSAMLNYYASKHPGFLSAATIINNYVNLLLPFVGFIIIGAGAHGLSRQVRQFPRYRTKNLLALGLVYIGIVYYRLVASTFHRQDVYHLSIWWIALTIVAPYLYMWFVGFQAAYGLYLYSRKVAGIVFRKGWNLVALGIGWLIVTSVGFQYVSTLSARLAHLSIYWLLVVIYSLLLVLSVGFVLIAIGTKKLQKIEEV